jgi:hypothetical protein
VESFAGATTLVAKSVLSYLYKQIRYPVSRQNYPPVSNPACSYNVSRRKHGSRCYRRAVPISTTRARKNALDNRQ